MAPRGASNYGPVMFRTARDEIVNTKRPRVPDDPEPEPVFEPPPEPVPKKQRTVLKVVASRVASALRRARLARAVVRAAKEARAKQARETAASKIRSYILKKRTEKVVAAAKQKGEAASKIAAYIKRMRLARAVVKVAQKMKNDRRLAAIKALRATFYNPRLGYIRNATTLYSRLPASARERLTVKEVRDFILNQGTIQINTQVRHRKGRHIEADRPGSELVMDLIDVSNMEGYHNPSFNWILTAIDVYSRFAWTVPMKTKDEQSAQAAVRIVLDKATKGGKFITRVTTDNGKEFVAGKVTGLITKQNDREADKDVADPSHVTVTPGDKNATGMIERFNGTLRRRLQLVFTSTNSKNWTKILDDITDNYNNSIHSSIDATPAQVWDGMVLPGGPIATEEEAAERFKLNKKAERRATKPRGYEKMPPQSRAMVGRLRVPVPGKFTKRAHHESYSRDLYEILPPTGDDAVDTHWYNVRKIGSSDPIKRVPRRDFFVVQPGKVGYRDGYNEESAVTIAGDKVRKPRVEVEVSTDRWAAVKGRRDRKPKKK